MATRLHPSGSTEPVSGEFVLYWLQVTMRARDNFALNHAIETANRLGQPMVVYQGLRPDYPWASDRIHTFILESAADLARDFGRMGIQYGFYLERERPRRSARSPLVELARRASLVVTDFFPTFIVPGQTAALERRLARSGPARGKGPPPPVVPVNSATIVPLDAVDREHATARGIRSRLQEALPHHLHAVGTARLRTRTAVELPFEAEAFDDIPALVAECAIDHTVPPSPRFRGGARAARARLRAFLESGLGRYDRDRSDPLAGASSGLSPYLHFGNISPHQLLLEARDATSDRNYRAFQDQVLTWRELSFNFAWHDRNHASPESIPAWARKELEDHESDPRPVLYDRDTLDQAATGDDLWNAAQQAYRQDGYMHNYLRMLWGKAVLQWTRNYRDAYRVLEHLNNRYALDGRDPNSYNGIGWIFGKFDRPFFRRPIYGTVRYMSLDAARKKFDAAALVRRFAPGGDPQQQLDLE